LYPGSHPNVAVHHVVKIRGTTPLSSKVISAHTLHSKLIFNLPLKKLLGEPLSHMGCGLARLAHSVARKIFRAQHPLGAEIWFSKKIDFVGIIALLNLCNWIKVYRAFFSQRGRNRGRKRTCPILNISIRSGDICTRSVKVSEIAPNLAYFCPLSPPLGEQAPKLFDRHL